MLYSRHGQSAARGPHTADEYVFSCLTEKISTIASHIHFHYLNTNKFAATRTFRLNKNGPRLKKHGHPCFIGIVHLKNVLYLRMTLHIYLSGFRISHSRRCRSRRSRTDCWSVWILCSVWTQSFVVRGRRRRLTLLLWWWWWWVCLVVGGVIVVVVVKSVFCVGRLSNRGRCCFGVLSVGGCGRGGVGLGFVGGIVVGLPTAHDELVS